ncbi:HEAT repeat domain-containing protein [Streptomyces sp. NBC_01257]|uniref:HEAT repeat domain-containing protein n=1 Tax=Streptomyces sp. NBC_01257 TaxID=2903799 RepID=UPI002DD7BB2B|nr:HEAT repeat domain-containing protein [Streptomyces sp. NBC_01257]WRZ63787.1 HEAT repeat domain-containing protein [Streptomyces sp. NBC_01257]
MPEGIDAIDWASLEHAYGPADDVPALLRAAASPDAEARGEAVDELFSSLCHQGSVYSATAPAVRFVARLALEGPGHRLPLLWLLHGAADGAGRDRQDVRRAVATALPALLGLAADRDPAVRRTMVWIIAGCEEASLPLLPLLRARLETEDDPEVRAALVTALGLLDVSPGPSRARNRELLHAPEPLVRTAAATDLLRTAPLPLPPALVESALDAHGAAPGDDDTHRPWPASYVPLTERLMADPDAALRAVERGLPLAWELTETWRDREAAVLPRLAAAATDADGLCRVARVGAALKGGEAAPWLDPHLRSDDPAVRVAATLAAVRLRVPGAPGLVLRLMDELPEEAASLSLTPLGVPGAVVSAAAEVFGAAAEPVARRVAARPRAEWLDALLPFPALAAACAGDLVRLLPASAGVLASLGPAAGPDAARALWTHAAAGDLTAALALARVDGDTEPALRAVRALPDAPERRRAAVLVASELGPPAAPLLPLLEERLRAPARESRADAAAAIWRVTGSAHDMAPVIADQLTRRADRHEPQLGALRTLVAMRLLPEGARPAVEHIAASPRRVVGGFPCDGSPHPDLAVRRAARELLALTG